MYVMIYIYMYIYICIHIRINKKNDISNEVQTTSSSPASPKPPNGCRVPPPQAPGPEGSAGGAGGAVISPAVVSPARSWDRNLGDAVGETFGLSMVN